MEKWISTADVAALLKVSKRTIQLRAQRENWTSQPRSGRGGGVEYHIDSLPESIRSQIAPIEITVEGHHDAQQVMLIHQTVTNIQHQKNIVALTSTNAHQLTDRENAQWTIYQAWVTHHRATGVSVVKSQYAFSDLYNAGMIEVDPCVRSYYPNISRGSIARWRSELKTKGSLRTNYGNRKGKSKIIGQSDLAQYLQSVLVTYPHIGAKTLYDGMHARFAGRGEFQLPSLRAVQRWMNDWMKQNSQVFTAISNPDQWKNKFMVAHGSFSEDVSRLNQIWEFDATPADLLLADGRYSLSGVIDVYSRRLKLFVTKTSKAVAVASLIRRALLDWGVPEVAKTDNGKEYTGHHITRVFASLDIEQVLCPPFQPWHKPHIERAFNTFSHDLLELLPGFIGHNVADRKELEARKSFADRLLKKNEVVELKISATELQTFCDRWCNSVYNHRNHAGLNNRTPFEMVANWTGELKRITDERALDLLLAEAPDNHGRRQVQKKGIRIKWPHESVSHHYISPVLGDYVGQQVHVTYDPAGDMGRVYVFGPEGFICIAECPELTGIDRKEYAELAKRQQRESIQDQRRSLKSVAKQIKVGDLAEQIIAHREQKHGNVTLFKRAGTEHESPLLIEAADAMKAADQMDTPAPVRPVAEASMARVVEMIEREERKPESPETRFKKAIAILDGTLTASPAEQEWLQMYQTSSEFRGRYMAWRSLGDGANRQDLQDDPWLQRRQAG